MVVGTIKHCPSCGEENYVRTGIDHCPNCGKNFDVWIPNKAPAGWVKTEDYEISRRSVETMLRNGDLTEKDLRDARRYNP